MPYVSLSELLLPHPTCFDMLCFHFHSVLFCCFLSDLLFGACIFQSVLFNLHVFEDILIFFPLLVSGVISWRSESTLYMTSVLCVRAQAISVSLPGRPVNRCILLLLSDMLCILQVGLLVDHFVQFFYILGNYRFGFVLPFSALSVFASCFSFSSHMSGVYTIKFVMSSRWISLKFHITRAPGWLRWLSMQLWISRSWV